MSLFKELFEKLLAHKKKVTSKKVALVKEVDLNGDTWKTYYYTTINGNMVRNSMFIGENNVNKAENFFNKVIELKGKTNSKTIIKSQYIE